MIALAFIAGLFVGGFVGLLAAALCVAARRGDEQLDRISNQP